MNDVRNVHTSSSQPDARWRSVLKATDARVSRQNNDAEFLPAGGVPSSLELERPASGGALVS